MGELIGFGSPVTTVVWGLVMTLVLGWAMHELTRKRLLTIPSYVVFWFYVLPIILQYPFARSPINVVSTGATNFGRYVTTLDRAFLISLLGMAAWAAGYVLTPLLNRNAQPGFAPARLVARGLEAWAQSSFLYLTSLFVVLLFGLMFVLGLADESGLREAAQATPVLRPLYNVAHTLLPLVIAVDFLVAVASRRRLIFVLGCLNVGLGLLTGARAVAFGGLLFLIVTLLAYRSLRRELTIGPLLRAIPIVAILLVLAVYLGDVRRGQYNIVATIANIGLRLFYGNNFSDLRDFAWVLAYWDGTYLHGRTELAGLLAFVPAFLSPFRAEWSWGVITTTLAGLDPAVTPGLRLGLFGEPYLNFGILGVLAAGLLFGYITRRLHHFTAHAARAMPHARAHIEILAGLVTLSLASRFLNTAGFFSFYVTIGAITAAWIVDRVLRQMRGAPLAAHEPLHPSTRHQGLDA